MSLPAGVASCRSAAGWVFSRLIGLLPRRNKAKVAEPVDPVPSLASVDPTRDFYDFQMVVDRHLKLTYIFTGKEPRDVKVIVH